MDELENILAQAPLSVRGGLASKEGKTCVLMQAYIGGLPVRASALVSDCTFIAQSAARIARGLFEIALGAWAALDLSTTGLHSYYLLPCVSCLLLTQNNLGTESALAAGRGWLSFAEKVLRVAKSLEQRAWNFRHPLRQLNSLPYEVYDKLEGKRASVETLRACALVSMPTGNSGFSQLACCFAPPARYCPPASCLRREYAASSRLLLCRLLLCFLLLRAPC